MPHGPQTTTTEEIVEETLVGIIRVGIFRIDLMVPTQVPPGNSLGPPHKTLYLVIATVVVLAIFHPSVQITKMQVTRQNRICRQISQPLLTMSLLPALLGSLTQVQTPTPHQICPTLTPPSSIVVLILFMLVMVTLFLFFILDPQNVIHLIKPLIFPIFFMFLMSRKISYLFNNFVKTTMFSLNFTPLSLL